MGLIKTAAIIAVGITLIPADPQDRANLYSKAHGVVHWAATFCDRYPKTCEHGHEIREAFLEKATFAASSAYEIVLLQLTSDQNISDTAFAMPAAYPARQIPGTLTRYDRQAEWRGRR